MEPECGKNLETYPTILGILKDYVILLWGGGGHKKLNWITGGGVSLADSFAEGTSLQVL